MRILDLDLFVPPKPVGTVKFGGREHAVYPLATLSVEDYCAFIDLDSHIRAMDDRTALPELGRLIRVLVPTITEAEIKSWRTEQLGRVLVWVRNIVAEDVARQAGGEGEADPPKATPGLVS